MTQQHYRAVTAHFSSHPAQRRLLLAANRFLPYLIAAIFFACGAWVLARQGTRAALCYFGVPAVKFLLVTALRAAVNAPRPYDRYDYVPLVEVRRGKGKSTPSRHTACAFAIARSLRMASPQCFVLGILLAALVGVCRVLTGCHAPKDVVLAVLFLA